MTSPIRIPTASSGNLALDLSGAASNFIQGLSEARSKRREEAMRDALLKLQQDQLAAQRENAAATQQFNMGTARRSQLDDLRGRGIDIDPSQPGVQLAADLTPVIAEAQRIQSTISQDPAKPGQPTEVNIGGIRATVRPYYDPMNIRTLTAEQGRAAAEARYNAYQASITDRQQRMLREPTPEENLRAGATTRALSSNKTLNALEAKDPSVANRAGIVEFFRTAGPNMSGEAAFAGLITKLSKDPAAQQYAIRMRNFISAIAQASIGKAWTVAELSTLLPGFFSFGFQTPEGLKELQAARDEAVRGSIISTGPGLIPLIRTGNLRPEDIPNFDAWRRYWADQYGIDIEPFVAPPGASDAPSASTIPRRF